MSEFGEYNDYLLAGFKSVLDKYNPEDRDYYLYNLADISTREAPVFSEDKIEVALYVTWLTAVKQALTEHPEWFTCDGQPIGETKENANLGPQTCILYMDARADWISSKSKDSLNGRGNHKEQSEAWIKNKKYELMHLEGRLTYLESKS